MIDLSGRIELHEVRDPALDAARDVIVYLPPSNLTGAERFPVMYLNDGQNLFDPATAFLGKDWRLGNIADGLIQSGVIQPLIIVGVCNRGDERVTDYTHVRDSRGLGGGAAAYGEWIIEHLKPWIDGRYSTLTDASNTGIGGSSLGGLVSLYLGLRYSQIFGKLLVMSPSVWWARRAILKEVNGLRSKTPVKIWLDVGTCEGQNPQECVKDVADLRQLLVAKGWQVDQDLAHVEASGGTHDENAWSSRIPDALRFLFPPTSQSPAIAGSSRTRRKLAQAK